MARGSHPAGFGFLLALALVPALAGLLRAQTNAPGGGGGASAIPAAPANYILGPNDMVLVEVFQEDDLKAERRVAEDGTVSLPLIERVKLGGLSVEESRNLIRSKLAADYLVNPRVDVTVTKPRMRRFTVLGEVQKPGSFEVSAMDKITLVYAIALAGGKTPKGNLSKVTVSRMADGRSQTFRLDVNAMSRDQGAAQFEVMPEDTITVPQSIF